MAVTSLGLRLRAVAAASLVLAAAACSGSDDSKAVATVTTESPVAVPAQWVTATAEHVVHGQELSPPAATRLLAYTAVALHEAASTSAPTGGEPLSGRLTGLPATTVEPD